MNLRRPISVMVLVMTVVASGALPASADDLASVLDDARRASYEGQQVVTCATPDGMVDAVRDLVQIDRVLAVRDPFSDANATVITPSGLATRTNTGSIATTEITPGSVPPATGFDVRVVGTARFLGRAVTDMAAERDGIVRLRMGVDDVTGTILWSETLDSNGSVYCRSELTSFRALAAIPGGSAGLFPGGRREDPIVLGSGDSAFAFPATLAGLHLGDVYPLDGDRAVAYYGDGLFSMTVLRADRRLQVADAELSDFSSSRGTYQRSFEASQALYVWEAAGGGYALVTDAPLDLQAAVLDELPAPRTPNIFVRLWRKLFG